MTQHSLQASQKKTKNFYTNIKDQNITTKHFNEQSLIQILKLPPGDYDLKVLDDTNNNGIWDTGKYSKKIKQQPEIVKQLSDVLNIKANWENEVNIIINK